MNEIQWTPPEPRKGMLGAWDKFVGPGATAAEEWLQLGGGLLVAMLLGLFLFLRRETFEWSGLQTAIAALLAFDLIGGIITNATSAAKRWYHRAGHDSLRDHLSFIALHALHLLLVAAVFRDMDWAFFVVMFGFLLLATVAIVRSPLYLQRPLAFTLFCVGFLIGTYLFVPVPGLEWFAPFFFLKLLVSHLVKEAPFSSAG
jgi:hypothetical protein